MEPKEKLVNFLIAKTRLIKRATGIALMDSRDYDDIREWPEEEIERFSTRLRECINELSITALTDDTICPWCVCCGMEGNNSCSPCNYGKRHGKCGFPSKINTYKAVLRNLPKGHGIVNVPGIQELVAEFIK